HHVDRTESVHCKFVKYLTLQFNCQLNNTYETRPIYFNLQALNVRRQFSAIIFIYKLLNNYIDAPEILALIRFYVPQYPVRKVPFFSLISHKTNYMLWSLIN